MSDDETKQLLRNLLETQKEYAEQIRLMGETYADSTKQYSELLEESKANQERYRRVTSGAVVLRSAALLIVGLVLAYLVFFGLHTH
jgi:hypothetical protein